MKAKISVIILGFLPFILICFYAFSTVGFEAYTPEGLKQGSLFARLGYAGIIVFYVAVIGSGYTIFINLKYMGNFLRIESNKLFLKKKYLCDCSDIISADIKKRFFVKTMAIELRGSRVIKVNVTPIKFKTDNEPAEFLQFIQSGC